MITLLQILLNPDSTIISGIEALSKKVDIIEKKVTVSPWIPVLSAILGGVLVWIGQHFDRKAKAKQALISELQELVTKCEKLSVNIKTALKELSTQKNSRIYWWYCYSDEHNALASRDLENEKTYLSNHYTACEALIKCGLKIEEILSEYSSSVSKFEILAKQKLDTEFIKNLLANTEFANAKEITAGITGDAALLEYENNCKELTEEYYKKFEGLEALNEILKEALTKK